MSTKQEDYQKKFADRKKKVLDFLDKEIDYLESCDAEDNTSLAEPVKKLRENVAEGLFSIVLVGEFSAGKSMFLNALMHQKILPTWSSETTATVNFLRHSSMAPNGEKGIVYYEDGYTESIKNLDKKSIEELVTIKREAEEGHGSIDHVDFFLDNKFLENGVMLIDSPGLNGLTPKLAEITDQQIQKSHASIFMFRSEQPGSKTDFQAIRRLREICPRIFFLLNQIDNIKKEEGETPEGIAQKIRNQYHAQFPEDQLPQIYPVSAKCAADARDEGSQLSLVERNRLERDSRMGTFEDRLWKYLTQGERAKENFLAPIQKALRLLGAERKRLTDMAEALNSKADMADVKKQEVELSAEIEKLNKREMDITQPLVKSFHQKQRDIADRLTNSCEKTREDLLSELNSGTFTDAEDLRQYGEDLPRVLAIAIQRLISRAEEDLQEELRDIVEVQTGKYMDDLESKMAEKGIRKFIYTPENLTLKDAEIVSRSDDFKEKANQLRIQIEKMEEEHDKLRRDRGAALRLENKRKDILREIKALEQRRFDVEATFNIPDVETHEIEVKEKRWRSGLLGKLVTPLIGKKTVTHMETVRDSTAHDEAITRRDKAIALIDEKTKSLESSVKQNLGYSSDEIDYNLQVLQDKIFKQKKRYEEAQEQFAKQLKEEDRKIANKYSRSLKRYVDDQIMTVERAAKETLIAREQTCLNAVQTMINAEIRRELQKYQQQLANLYEVEKASEADKKKKLTKISEQQHTIKELLNEAIALQGEIENTMVDSIEEG